LIPCPFFGRIAHSTFISIESSEEVRSAAHSFGKVVEKNLLRHLFSQDYGNGRKLILFWDSLDSAYNTPEAAAQR